MTPGYFLVIVGPGANGASLTTLSGHLEAAIRLLEDPSPVDTSVRS